MKIYKAQGNKLNTPQIHTYTHQVQHTAPLTWLPHTSGTMVDCSLIAVPLKTTNFFLVAKSVADRPRTVTDDFDEL